LIRFSIKYNDFLHSKAAEQIDSVQILHGYKRAANGRLFILPRSQEFVPEVLPIP
jgi:hypothetical protein